jgi:acid phosphatase (class A)
MRVFCKLRVQTLGFLAFVFLALGVLVFGIPVTNARTTTGYLNGASLNYEVPPPPTPGSAVDQLDLVMVRTGKATPGSPLWQEAVIDATTFGPAILSHFQDAIGVPLIIAEHPILAQILDVAGREAAAFSDAAKDKYPRKRPYVGHSDIQACDMTRVKDDRSYPSGHSLRGYLTALILADVYPARTQEILARGVLFGDRRVACGVHHPIDVQQGRLLAIAYMTAIRAQSSYQTAIECAKQEDAVVRGTEKALPTACKAILGG